MELVGRGAISLSPTADFQQGLEGIGRRAAFNMSWEGISRSGCGTKCNRGVEGNFVLIGEGSSTHPATACTGVNSALTARMQFLKSGIRIVPVSMNAGCGAKR